MTGIHHFLITTSRGPRLVEESSKFVLIHMTSVVLVTAFVGAKLLTFNSKRIAQVKAVKTRIRCI